MFSAISHHIGSLVHPSAAGDEIAFAHHRAFIASHLAGGLLAFAALPLIVLARDGQPSPAEIAVMIWLVAPILAALDLSRNGQLERAHFISISSLALLILSVAAMTGGVTSFALIWLPVVAFEAAFSGSRRVIFASFGLVAMVVLALSAVDAAGYTFSVRTPEVLPEITALMAVIYAGALALRWDNMQRKIVESHSSRETRYRLLAENTSDLVTRHTANGSVTFASPAAARFLGVRAAELQGRGMFERVHIADRPVFLTALSHATQGIESTVEFRVRMALDSASYGSLPQYIWVQMKCRLDGTGVTAVTRELPARQPVSTGKMEIAKESRSSVKGRFLASMSHELRTPLNAIIGFSELLADRQFTDEKRRHEYADLIHESGLHLLSVVNGILDMSRLDSGNFAIVAEPFGIKPVVESCIQLFALKAAAASVELASDVGEDLPEVLADKRACKQIVINLVSNAVKFTPSGGRVCVSARPDGDMLRIEVTDTGIGIASEDIPNLGTSFFQARSAYDRPYDGTGIGLSVVKGLVELHSGSFEVRSEIGRGTRVSVCLPMDTISRTSEKTTIDNSVPQSEQKRTATG